MPAGAPTSRRCGSKRRRSQSEEGRLGRPLTDGLVRLKPDTTFVRLKPDTTYYFSGMNAMALLAFIGMTSWFAPAS